MNFGLHTGDAPGIVLKNRSRALAVSGMGEGLPVLGRQVHGVLIRQARAKDAGRGWKSQETAFSRTDGLVTSVPGLPLGIATADCLPVLFAVPGGKAVGAAHAGWRGLADGILPGLIARFQKALGVFPGDLWAAIGPAIGPSAFVVRGEVRERLSGLFPEAVCRRYRGGAATFDLWRAAVSQLVGAGMRPRQIRVLRQCTFRHPRAFYSHRRDGARTGRMLALVRIEEG